MTSLIPQYGIGIELRENSLVAVFAKRSFGRLRMIDRLEINNLKESGPAVCGSAYHEFLKRNNLKSPWTAVCIPRKTALLRRVRLPGSVAGDLHAVIALQIDSLHPLPADDLIWDCSVLSTAVDGGAGATRGGAVEALVAMAERTAIHELSEWLKACGIPVSQFIPAPLLLEVLSTHQGRPQITIIAYSRDGGWDLIGIGSDGRTATGEIDHGTSEPQENLVLADLRKELENICAGLRLDASALPSLFIGGDVLSNHQLLAAVKNSFSSQYRVTFLDGDAISNAAAAISVAGDERLGINLLPVEARHYESPAALIPTYGLAAVLLVLGMILGFQGVIRDWQYSKQVDAEIEALRPRIAEIESLRGRASTRYSKLLSLIIVRESAHKPLEVLDEITRLLPGDAWLQSFQLDGVTLTLSGSASSASSVLQALSEAKRIESARFLSAIARSNDGREAFRIGANVTSGIR